MGIKILHLADLHIGYVPGYLADDRAPVRAQDFREALKRAVDFALEPDSGIRAVIIAGDLFEHPRPASADVGFVRGQFERLLPAKTPVLLAPGTHDTIAVQESVYRRESFPTNVRILAEFHTTMPVELLLDGEKFSFYWLTHEPGKQISIGQHLSALKDTLPADGYRVFVAHASLKGCEEWNVRAKDLPVTEEELRSSGMHYVAFGHYHTFRAFRLGKTTAVYPGTLEGKGFGENGRRFLVTADFSAGCVAVTKRPFNARVLEEKELSLDTEAVSSEEELLAWVASGAGENTLLRLTLTGRAEFMVRPEFLQAALRDRFFHIEIEDRTSILGAAAVEMFAQERTIRGMFVRRMKEAIARAPQEARAVHELALKEGLSAFAEESEGAGGR
ncbi:MAG: DNA repair exonuclease [Candidatus Eisenbacteria bacterium]